MAMYISRPARRADGASLAARLGLTGRRRGLGLLGVRSAGSSAAPAPKLRVAAAMDLVRSLMVLGDVEGLGRPPPASSAEALASRFTEDEIKQAFGELRAAGWVRARVSVCMVDAPTRILVDAPTRFL